MTDKIQEITEKIYNDGVIKAKNDSDQIISDAKARADEIINSAKNTQQELLDTAQKLANEIKQKTNTELQLAGRQFISKLKQQITQTICTSQVKGHIKNALSDNDFIKEILLHIVKNWSSQKSEDIDLKILLSEQKEKELRTFFESKARDTLDKGVEIEFDSNIKSGFKISPKNGSYFLSFSEKDFENYFKSYIKDNTRKLLFDSVEKESKILYYAIKVDIKPEKT